MIIVHVITRLLRAGSEENTLASCRAQAASGHDVYIVHGTEFDPRWYESLPGEIKLVRVDSLVHALAPAKDLQAFWDIRRQLRKLRPDIVHTHQSKAGIVGRFAAKAAGVPRIVHGVHIVPFVNVSPMQKMIYLGAERAAALFTDEFIHVSRGVHDIYVDAGLGRADNHHIIHSGFDLARFRNAAPPSDWREILGLAPDDSKPPVILMLAALEPRKRHSEFLEAFPRIVARCPEVRLIMPGEGRHHDAILAKVAELGLEKNVKLLGYRSDPERLIALADICALTSTREGLPRVIMQYLVGGRPVVVTELPGISEVVRHGENGVIVPPDDITAAADRIADLIADPAELGRLTAGAQSSDLSSWEVDKMCASIERLYTSMFQRRYA